MNDNKFAIIKQSIIKSINKISDKLDNSDLKSEISQKIAYFLNQNETLDLISKIQQYKDWVLEQLKIQNESITQTIIQKKININIDLTMPVYANIIGTIHPISKIIQQASDIINNMGFKICYGPDIEDEFHNFDALNIPYFHPARQMVDTFYIKKSNNMLLRTHTSSIQIHYIKDNPPPLKIFSIGRVFRKDSDTTHTPMFHQMEILCINHNANMLELISILKKFLMLLLEKNDLEYRIRSSYFPFTEPSIEIDIKINNQWLEVMGAGMVHPNILMNAKIDPMNYQGYAWGLGLDRIAMIKYNIENLHDMFNSNIKWLQYYGLNR